MTKNKKQNRQQKKEKKNHTWKKNEVCLLFPNFKTASSQTKIYFLKIIFIIKHIKKTRIFLKKKKEKRKINKRKKIVNKWR
jgi:hypothetical protein